jgi:hypothetical protein
MGTPKKLLVRQHLRMRKQCHEGLMLATNLLRMAILSSPTPKEGFFGDHLKSLRGHDVNDNTQKSDLSHPYL